MDIETGTKVRRTKLLWAGVVFTVAAISITGEARPETVASGAGLKWVEQCEEDKLTGGKKNCENQSTARMGAWTTSCIRDKRGTSCRTTSDESRKGNAVLTMEFTCGNRYTLSKRTEREARINVTGPRHSLENDWSTYGKSSILTSGGMRAIGERDEVPLDVGYMLGSWTKWNRKARLKVKKEMYGAVRTLVQKNNNIKVEVNVGSTMEERIFVIDGRGSTHALAIADKGCGGS